MVATKTPVVPKKIGAEFVADEATQGHAAGILYIAPDGDVLLLRRSSTEENFAGHWALPGGKGEAGETPEQTADREAHEEMKVIPESAHAMKLLDSRVTPKKMAFHTFVQLVPAKFVPDLNEEHSGFAWAPMDQLPMPMHPAVKQTLIDRLGLSEGMAHDDWDGVKKSFVEWAKRDEPDDQEDGRSDIDARLDRLIERRGEGAHDSIAMDKDSVRRFDADGHLFVEMTPISKANVCPYYGKEIPDFRGLGLDPDKIYQLYRDPKELEKAAASFAGKPLLLVHTPISADDHPRNKTVGAIGTGVVFKAPYLMAPLSVWDGEAIELIDSKKQRELSSAYRYRADMTPGTVDGEAFDGVMRDIGGNHVALVSEGRAGPDVVVGDEQIKPRKETDMAKKPVVMSRMASVAHGAILAYLRPKIAQDAKIDLVPILKGVTAKNYDAKLIGADLQKVVTGKLAQDADISDVVDLLDTLKAVGAAEDDLDPNAGQLNAGKVRGEDEDLDTAATEKARVMEFLKNKLSEDEMKACDELWNQEAMDDDIDDEEAAKKKAAEDEDKTDMVDKKAMDAAITAAVANERRNAREIETAKEDVRPYIGAVAMAHDSAADVYRTALTSMNVDITGVHPTAFKAILKAQPVPGSQPAPKNVVAMDAKSSASFYEMFPAAKTHIVKTL
jgi:8-oxo-dGTP pyrophosphatase MutT (NUDIX family)